MFDNIIQFFKKFKKSEKEESKNTAKERLHLVLAQDRANISADFLEMMKQEIIEVIKKYIDIDEKAIDVRLTNKESETGTVGAPSLYANIPIINIKNEAKKVENTSEEAIKEESIEDDEEKEDVKSEENTETENKEEIQQETSKEENEAEEQLDDTTENKEENEAEPEQKQKNNNIENEVKDEEENS